LVVPAVALAIGPERGWSGKERGLLADQWIYLGAFGSRVLRTETACVAAIAMIKGRLGLM